MLFRSECYLHMPASDKKPVSIFKIANGDNKNLLAVHSMSKRSNLAGYRAALLVGDSQLIAKIREIRKHAGMMVPQPIQRAIAVALTDEEHVIEQADCYRRRRAVLREALKASGFSIEYSHAGLYLWCTRNEEDWSTVSWFADRGIIVTPGQIGRAHV